MVLSVHCMYGDLTVQLNHIHTLSILVVTSGAQEAFICWFSINSCICIQMGSICF